MKMQVDMIKFGLSEMAEVINWKVYNTYTLGKVHTPPILGERILIPLPYLYLVSRN